MEDLFIGQPSFAKPLNLSLSNGGGIPCDPLGILQDRQRLEVEIRLSVVLGKLLDQCVVLRFPTESLSVVDDSVVAPIDRRDD